MRSYHKKVWRSDIEWMRGLPVRFADEHHIYVRGGLKLDVPLEEQEDHMQIRGPFLEAQVEALPAHVVHGHTPV